MATDIYIYIYIYVGLAPHVPAYTLTGIGGRPSPSSGVATLNEAAIAGGGVDCFTSILQHKRWTHCTASSNSFSFTFSFIPFGGRQHLTRETQERGGANLRSEDLMSHDGDDDDEKGTNLRSEDLMSQAEAKNK